ncbi:hypothetical protein BC939DRAFT_466928 [Gamsiella multidivaricata]|uniref:uncharacterized protein n=1 Tax=Gamsiella multidivaricata TaxID=101098 RepID=UPI00222097B8|nr:uncharacterized protein BC939DRAFT_466928 [Gamsiella multidivaricata]KAI7817119.1 hypothetical protein BC939DRAFT_466928 [Gamsiella multidivaricata]
MMYLSSVCVFTFMNHRQYRPCTAFQDRTTEKKCPQINCNNTSLEPFPHPRPSSTRSCPA